MATKKVPSLLKLAADVKTENTEVANWQAREDLACLTRAREVEADKKRMMAVKKIAASQMKNLQKITGK